MSLTGSRNTDFLTNALQVFQIIKSIRIQLKLGALFHYHAFAHLQQLFRSARFYSVLVYHVSAEL